MCRFARRWQRTTEDTKLYGMGLPSSGGITSIQALNLLEGYGSKLDRAKVAALPD